VSESRNLTVDIRPWSDRDLALLERLLGDPAMTAHLGGPETPQKIRERHERYSRSDQPGLSSMFVIVLGPERADAGSIGYWQKEWQGQLVWETGFSVLPEYQGQGIATRALAKLAGHAGRERKHRFLHAFPAVDNVPSNAICRKAGFTFQGQQDFEYPPGHPVHCNDWRLDLLPTEKR
jgi:RimJ/RimL family protein N-acetyltransferase